MTPSLPLDGHSPVFLTSKSPGNLLGKSDGQDIASPLSLTSRESKGHKMEDYIGSNDTALVGRISFTKRFDQTFVELVCVL